MRTGIRTSPRLDHKAQEMPQTPPLQVPLLLKNVFLFYHPGSSLEPEINCSTDICQSVTERRCDSFEDRELHYLMKHLNIWTMPVNMRCVIPALLLTDHRASAFQPHMQTDVTSPLYPHVERCSK